MTWQDWKESATLRVQEQIVFLRVLIVGPDSDCGNSGYRQSMKSVALTGGPMAIELIEYLLILNVIIRFRVPAHSPFVELRWEGEGREASPFFP
ncbi:hypothetical protein BT96DRAFT_450046 [Gymnopus androsaceus JB14]|uniref:Uncharacterized protein n=1 Tax=Gymnopus androsaceus JB14 TaxID=1447944 RepID=A0A6A4GRF7_9AGAR|nr:hypothetical protein BT96DRAFT_450046 [Gymnopus androsaceus JB14]